MKLISYLFICVFTVTALFSCSTSKQESQKEEAEMVEQAPEAPPPGQADLLVKILKGEKMGDKYVYTVSVQNVFGYGMSTKPLANGTELKMEFSEDEMNYAKEMNADAFAEGSKIYLRAAQPMEAMGDATPQNWNVIQINKK